MGDDAIDLLPTGWKKPNQTTMVSVIKVRSMKTQLSEGWDGF